MNISVPPEIVAKAAPEQAEPPSVTATVDLSVVSPALLQPEPGKSRQTELAEESAKRVLLKPRKTAQNPPQQAPGGEVQEYAAKLVTERFGAAQVASMLGLISRESGGGAGRLNKNSLACGIPQALPCTKLYPEMTKAKISEVKIIVDGKWYLPSPDWRREVEWMVNYIAERYQSPKAALSFHSKHGWY